MLMWDCDVDVDVDVDRESGCGIIMSVGWYLWKVGVQKVVVVVDVVDMSVLCDVVMLWCENVVEVGGEELNW